MTSPQAPVDGAHLEDGLDGAILEVDVGPIVHGGHCVARVEGQVVFVRHALPDERVRAVITEHRSREQTSISREAKGYLRADAIEILAPSPHRIEPPCPYAGPDRCGGCDLQHADLGYQRELKAAVVVDQLQRLAGMAAAEIATLELAVRALPDIAGEEPGMGWRTRVQYTVDSTGQAGLLKHRSHEVVPVDRCLIAHAAIRSTSVLTRSWPDLDGVDVVAAADGQVSVLGRRARGSAVLIEGPARAHEKAVGREWTVPADAFWQVHPAAADTLATTVVELLGPRRGERVWDLYGGAGLFAAALAPHLGSSGRVTVVEGDPRAAAAATRLLRDLTTVTVLRADVARALANRRWRAVDLVVLDPPRSGAGVDVVASLLARSPRAVAYVACDPAAFARDVRAFRDGGYRLAELRAYDLFPQTHHVECVGLFLPR